MLQDRNKFEIVAGEELVNSLNAEKEHRVPRNSAGYYLSEPLCDWQREVNRRRIMGAELVLSAYGWSVRYDSGLMDFALLASSRAGTVDGSYEDAVRWVNRWVSQDPNRRYAWRRRVDQE